MADDTPTTNDVLKETINGLVKLTDERFSQLKESLTRIEQAGQHYVTRTELEEVKKDYTTSIKRMQDSQDGLSKQFTNLSRLVWIGMGGLGAIEFGLQIWSQLHK